MLTKIIIKNFKKFEEVEVDLGNPVVFIGPNNSGKTSVLQALSLWEIGIKRWNEKRKGKHTPEKRPGVTINRRDLISSPVPSINLLWRNLHTRDVQKRDGKPDTKHINIDVIIKGITRDQIWKCGLEFDYANEESLYCRPLRISESGTPDRMSIPDQAGEVQIAFLPPMSGLAASETKLPSGRINVLVGEGRTAEVLRNLCYNIYKEKQENWELLIENIKSLFGAELNPPEFVPERGEIIMSYKEKDITLDLSSSGRGLQQTLLVLAYMYANPGSVLLLDEPDAHLEILRQRQIYQLLNDIARENGNQIIAASHSEVLLNEAADRDVVIAFVGKPHRIDDRGSQVLKSLREIGFEQYYLAEQMGWVLYLEGSADLSILKAFAKKLNHREAMEVLGRPFVHYVGDQPNEVRRHFYGLREAVRHLKGISIFDRLDRDLPDDLGSVGLIWKKREIENYLCFTETLISYAEASAEEDVIGPLFTYAEQKRRSQAMKESIDEVKNALLKLKHISPWDPDTKVSTDFLEPLFEEYFSKLNLPNIMAKKNYHELVEFVPTEKLDHEISKKLDAIVKIARSAKTAEQ